MVLLQINKPSAGLLASNLTSSVLKNIKQKEKRKFYNTIIGPYLTKKFTKPQKNREKYKTSGRTTK